MCSRSSAEENRAASARPQTLANPKPTAAPSVIPSQEATVAAGIPNCDPANVLTRLDGIGKKISLDSSATVISAIAAGEGGGSSQASTIRSSRSPKPKNGSTGTSSTRLTIASGRRRLRMGVELEDAVIGSVNCTPPRSLAVGRRASGLSDSSGVWYLHRPRDRQANILSRAEHPRSRLDDSFRKACSSSASANEWRSSFSFSLPDARI
jgi:hypothetical protein